MGSNISWGQAVIVLDKPIEEVLPIVRDYANYVQLGFQLTEPSVRCPADLDWVQAHATNARR